MPTVARVAGFVIVFYLNDHDPPHFHAIAPDVELKLFLPDTAITVVAGRLRRADRDVLVDWTAANRAALLENWYRLRQGKPPLKIEA